MTTSRSPGQNSCTRPGLWQDPTPAFIAGLPREPRALLARLQADAVIHGTGLGQEALLFAAAALERGIPTSLHADIYRALALLPGLALARDRVVLADGRAGAAVSLDARGARVELAVDPQTGAFLGWRRVLTTTEDGLPPGTVTIMKVVRTAIVSTIGRRPSSIAPLHRPLDVAALHDSGMARCHRRSVTCSSAAAKR